MSNKDSSHEFHKISHYVNLALSFMPILDQYEYLKFHSWINKFEYVADMIKVPNDKLIKFFEKMVDEDFHKRIKESFSDQNYSELSYENIINYYVFYMYDTKQLTFHRERFQSRYQYEKETIEKYSNNLQKLHNKCEYKIDSETILCKQFRSGIRSDDIKAHLARFPNMTYAETVEKAIALENEKVMTYSLNLALSKINTYNSSTESEFHIWLNKFEYIAEMIEVPDELMLEFFEKMVDDGIHTNVKKIYPILCLLNLTYEDTILYYLKYFSPLDVDLHMKRFMCRNQYENETIDRYAKNLLKLLNKCSNVSNKNEILCKQFLNGISDDNLRNNLIKNLNFSFKKMVRTAIKFLEENKINSYVNEALRMINIYNPKNGEKFYMWLNRFEYVANKIKIPNDKIGKVFIRMIHNEVYTTLINNYPYVDFFKLSCNNIISYYLRSFVYDDKFYLYKRLFECRIQYDDESLQNYIINLQKLFKKCNYKTAGERRLCKQFQNGIRSDYIKEKLMKHPSTTFPETIEKAIALEKEKDMIDFINLAQSMIDTYNSSTESEFHVWLNKFEYIADIFEVPHEIMLEFFEKMVDNNVHADVKKNYPIFCLLKLSYEHTIPYYLKYFSPMDVDLHVKRFQCRNQYEKETIAKYSNNLKKIYDKLDDTSRQEINLCEKFINGIISDDIRSHLNNISGLSFDEMVSKAVNMEEKLILVASQMNESYKTTETKTRKT